MSFGQTHGQLIVDSVNEALPQAEDAFHLLRKPLAAELEKHKAALAQHIRSSVLEAFAVYGRALRPEQVEALEPVVAEVAEERMENLEALKKSLRAGDRTSLRTFADTVVADLLFALEVHDRAQSEEPAGPAPKMANNPLCQVGTELGMSPDDVRQVIVGDSAFRALHYFLQFQNRVMKEVKPVNMLSLRAG